MSVSSKNEIEYKASANNFEYFEDLGNKGCEDLEKNEIMEANNIDLYADEEEINQLLQ